MITLFDDPPRASLTDSTYWQGSPEVLLLGFALKAEHRSTLHTLHALVCTEDGQVSLVPATAIVMHWAYDIEQDRWVDTDNRPLVSLETDQDT